MKETFTTVLSEKSEVIQRAVLERVVNVLKGCSSSELDDYYLKMVEVIVDLTFHQLYSYSLERGTTQKNNPSGK